MEKKGTTAAFRKPMRLSGYNYSQAGYYFVTIYTLNRRSILGRIVRDAVPGVPHVPHCRGSDPPHPAISRTVGDAVLGVPHMEYTPVGEQVISCLEGFNQNHDTIQIDTYVVMPNHVHIILAILQGTPRTASPTKAALPKAINAIKSLATKRAGRPIWQRGYYDHIIRDENDYLARWNYIESNPARWAEDVYYQST